jgi:hypothetical protein
LHPRPLLEYLCGPTSRQHVRNPTQRTCINCVSTNPQCVRYHLDPITLVPVAYLAIHLGGNRFRPETAPLGTTSLIESTPDIQRTSVASHPEVWVHPIPKSKTDPQITESNSWWLRTPSATDPFHSVNLIPTKKSCSCRTRITFLVIRFPYLKHPETAFLPSRCLPDSQRNPGPS